MTAMCLEKLTLAAALENGQQGAWVGAGAGRHREAAAGMWKRGGGGSPGWRQWGQRARDGLRRCFEEMPRPVAGLVMGLGGFAS